MFRSFLVLALVVAFPLTSLAGDAESRTIAAGAASAATAWGSGSHGPATAGPFAGDVNWSMTPLRMTSSDAARGSVLPSLYVSLAALNAFDAYTTSRGIRTAAAGEANPLMTGVAGHPAALWAVKGGTTAATVLLSERLRKTHHRVAALATMIASNGLVAIVSVHNARAATIR